MGVDVFTGTAGSKVLFEEGAVVGIQTGDMGISKTGEPKDTFTPGI